MKKFIASVNVMPLKDLLDPQGKAVAASMKNLGLPEITDVRIGKHITLHIDAENEKMAGEKVELACKKLLANPVIEFFEYHIVAE